MSVPGPLPPAGPGPQRGQRAFRAGLALGGAALLGGLLMLLLASGAVAAAGTALLVLGVVGLLCVALGFLAEELVRRRSGRSGP
jgi:hypothetical protein